jgi:hypothetical protein
MADFPKGTAVAKSLREDYFSKLSPVENALSLSNGDG